MRASTFTSRLSLIVLILLSLSSKVTAQCTNSSAAAGRFKPEFGQYLSTADCDDNGNDRPGGSYIINYNPSLPLQVLANLFNFLCVACTPPTGTTCGSPPYTIREVDPTCTNKTNYYTIKKWPGAAELFFKGDAEECSAGIVACSIDLVEQGLNAAVSASATALSTASSGTSSTTGNTSHHHDNNIARTLGIILGVIAGVAAFGIPFMALLSILLKRAKSDSTGPSSVERAQLLTSDGSINRHALYSERPVPDTRAPGTGTVTDVAVTKTELDASRYQAAPGCER